MQTMSKTKATTEFKIGVSPITNTIYAGNVRNGMWVGKKHDVTGIAVIAVAQHLFDAEQELRFTDKDGNDYALRIVKLADDEQS